MEIQAETGETPAALLNRPILEDVWRYPYMVWTELSTAKYSAEAPDKFVKFSEVYIYSKAYGLSTDEMSDLWNDLRAIDSIWAAETAKKQESQAKSKQKSTGSAASSKMPNKS